MRASRKPRGRKHSGNGAAEGGHALFPTALGEMGIAWSERGLVAVALPEAGARATEARLLARAFSERRLPPAWARRAMARIAVGLTGEPRDLGSIPLDLSRVPPFYRRVYEALRELKWGRTVSYSELAGLAGSPGASRAVGQAMRRNPLPLVIPCHRVLAAGGRAGGFSAYGGVATKERLLELEGVKLSSGAVRGNGLAYSPGAAAAHLRSRDRHLARLIARVGPPALPVQPLSSPFEALLRAIVYQQLNGRAAATILGRVLSIYAPRRFPRPQDILATDPARLRAAGLSRSKLAAILDLARKTDDGELPSYGALRKMDDEAIVERLTSVRGIGRWTVEMLLIFRLGRPDVLPVTDFGVRKGYASVMRKRELPSPAALERHGEKWRPYRSVAAWYLWRAVDTPGTPRTGRERSKG